MVSQTFDFFDDFPIIERYGHRFLLTLFPIPPQLPLALEFPKREGERLGIWKESGKTAISNGFLTRICDCIAWDIYLRHPLIADNLRNLISRSFDLYENSPQVHSEWAFLLEDQDLLLGQLNLVKTVLTHNSDHRPDWISQSSLKDWQDINWLERYGAWQSRQLDLYPFENRDSYAAIQDMIFWLNAHNQ